ncbi:MULTISPECIES: alpha-L-fucosidase [Sphingomonas]|jgi:alpha-L-fucosidase|uniref:alpha-L-fucosidase n=1 Tax=Sphingomonas zeae TaxID=1646122 RepID=A0A7Y6B4I1_9SPHN|nr:MULTISPECIES: alpha-L-fucosidase [Sphingomonas]MBB4048442.1 alpha-L-fucosidase [Sphingomonas zeae]MDK8187255.1 alpha-L-fucosidase [Sphingomonas zeae]MDK8216997.1 alpha-L-fucosidase [Sphingomonas sp. UMB7805-LC452B]NUU46845.1 alpha-L-fucosidase [Sphingomonas zeae]
MTDFSRRAVIASGLVASAAPAFAQKGAGAPAPYGAIPSARQWRWHQREQYAFIHFAMNTFTDKEWGYGDEDPKMFNPSDFSADQIVAAAKAGNLKGIILTAKHHDGFCLWPTKLTEHCIRNSPYKNGQGDIVREMSDACKRAGLAFGIYLSPWDRNRADYGRPSYVDYFRKQVVELCTGYGELFEFWFDGANGGDGYYGGARETRQIDAPKYYNWPSIIALVHQYQPMACTFDPLGADIRWVGNEDGIAGDPCWPTMPNHPYVQSEGNSGVRGAPLWWPAETNTSIRPGWFYHADEDSKVRSPENLVGYFDTSVARGTNMNLNLPPDRRGRIPDQDVKILKSFGDAIRASFATDLAQGSVASASHVRGKGYEAARVLDGQRDTYWSAPDGVTTPSLTLDLPPNRSFDLIRIREYLPLGVRVTRFAVDAEVNGTWQQLAEHECISAQRIIRLPQPITARRVRLRIVDAPVCPAISEVSLFKSVAPVPVPAIVSSDPTVLATTDWKIVSATAPGAEKLLDNDAKTIWVQPAPVPGKPASVTVDMGQVRDVAGFSLTPSRQVMVDAAPPRGYVVETSVDGKSWTPAGAGEFSNIAYALSTQRLPFTSVRPVRYLRLTFAEMSKPAAKMAIAGIGGFTKR